MRRFKAYALLKLANYMTNAAFFGVLQNVGK